MTVDGGTVQIVAKRPLTSTVRVLLVEDNPGDVDLVADYLEERGRFDLVVAHRLAEAVEVVGQGEVDCILLDLSLPDAEGLEGLRTLRGMDARLPIVVLTGLSDALLGEDAVDLGAQDYLLKRDLNASALERAIRYAGGRQRQHVALEDAYARLAEEILERERATAALREAEERFRLSFENAPIGIALVALDGRWLKVNRALCEIVGYRAEMLLTKTFQDISHPDDLEADLEYVRQMLAGEIQTYSMEKRYLHADGHVVWINLSVSLARGGDGRPMHFVSQIENITGRKQAEERLLHQALHDALTGLPNRVLLYDRLEQALSRRERHHDSSMAVLFLDLDRFKLVNDSLGHDTGDRLIVEVAQRLREVLRPTDTIARIGGDEFVILVEDLDDRDEATTLAERVRAAVGVPFRLKEGNVVPSVSVGIAFAEEHHHSPQQLLREADTAMYRAKERGKDRYEIFEDTLRVRAAECLGTD
jgi:diguanylate cyclase (GGDEF)-like protein/PAS domain S-box-containing protein